MTSEVITDPSQASAAWLEQALAGSGALRAGGVADVAIEPVGGTWSRMIRLTPSYRPGSLGDLPSQLLLKLCGAEGGVFGRSEVDYYTGDYVGLDGAPIPRCYAAAYQEGPRRYHLLLEDLSATHAPCWDRAPSEDHGRALADAVAALHSHRWAEAPDPGAFTRYMAHVGAGLEPMLALTESTIAPHWPARLRQIFAQIAPRYEARAQRPEGMTLLHGDLNSGNILAPRVGDAPVYLIDRQPFDWSLTRWLGVSDLAYAMVLWWETPARRNYEEPTLRRYHAALRARGVSGYSWGQLYADYRLCIVESIAVAAEWCVLEADRERMRWVWERQLTRALAAFEDLDCGELWRV